MTAPLPQLIDFLRTAEEGTHHLLIGRTRYTLYARPGTLGTLIRRNRKRESPPPAEDHHAKALHLYGSEAVAAVEIRRQLATMGSDVDPGVRHRATRLADQLANGHVGELRSDNVRVWCDERKIHVDAPFKRVRAKTLRSISIWLRLLKRDDLRPDFSMEEVETLRRLGLTISILS